MDKQSHIDFVMYYMFLMHQTVYYLLPALMMQGENLREEMANASSKINQIILLGKEYEWEDSTY